MRRLNPGEVWALVARERHYYRRKESRQAVVLLERRLRRAGQHEAAEVLRFVALAGGAGLPRRELGRLLVRVFDALDPLVERLNADELGALGRFSRGIAPLADPPRRRRSRARRLRPCGRPPARRGVRRHYALQNEQEAP